MGNVWFSHFFNQWVVKTDLETNAIQEWEWLIGKTPAKVAYEWAVLVGQPENLPAQLLARELQENLPGRKMRILIEEGWVLSTWKWSYLAETVGWKVAQVTVVEQLLFGLLPGCSGWASTGCAHNCHRQLLQ
jgi:hypothetical protein